jgi:glucokinase
VPHAELVWRRVVEAGGIGLANLAQLYCPQVIVVGGGLGLVGELFLQPLRDAVARLGPPYLPEPIEVVGAELGDDAGLRGTAAWGRPH